MRLPGILGILEVAWVGRMKRRRRQRTLERRQRKRKKRRVRQTTVDTSGNAVRLPLGGAPDAEGLGFSAMALSFTQNDSGMGPGWHGKVLV